MWTDKLDYSPGETAIITGSGFWSGEAVDLKVVKTSTGSTGGIPPSWTVTANSQGGFQTSWTATSDLVGATLELDAKGESSLLTALEIFTDKVTPTVTVTSSANPSSLGQSITFTATVSGTSSQPQPTGTVSFFIDPTNPNNPNNGQLGGEVSLIGSGPNSSTATSQATSSLTVGTHHIYAVYNNHGDTNYNSGNPAVVDQVVNNNTTTTNVVSSANPSTYGSSVTFTATVTGTSTPTGSLNFVIDGGAPVAGTVGSTTSTTAKWTYTTSTLAVSGSPHTVQAFYVHTGSFVDSNGTLSGGQTVNKANAIIVVTAYHVTYDGNPHTATGTATGVESPTPVNLSGLLTLSGTTHTNAGDYPSDAWSFAGNGNYNSASNTVHDIIDKRNTSTQVTFASNPINEGSGTTVTVTVKDTDVTAAQVNVDPTGTITFSATGTLTLSASGTLVPNGNGTSSCLIMVTGLDNPGGTVSASFAGDAIHFSSNGNSSFLTVNNVAPTPTITAPDVNSWVFAVGTAVNFKGSFTDPGGTADAPYTAVWSFDNISATVSPAPGMPGPANTTYTFSTAGVYNVSLTVTDKDGASGMAKTVGLFNAEVVIYDPSAGFVTGGGWINSPAGAYAADPTLTGKANFGFTSKYKKGQSVPTGETEFQFQVANFNFHSTSYDWLVVAGAKAQYKGSGTVNGTGNYGFMLTAIDGQINGGGGVDKFRFKVWDINSNATVYDNQMGATDTTDPTTTLGGGSIVIHAALNAAVGSGETVVGTNSAPLTQEVLKPLVERAVAEWRAAGVDEASLSTVGGVEVRVTDLSGTDVGLATPGVIWIDQNADGNGWFVDTTPVGDSEFGERTAGHELRATPDSPAYGRMDLLTVMTHEMGHLLGFEHDDGDDVMAETLAVGERRTPESLVPAGQPAGSLNAQATSLVLNITPAGTALVSQPNSAGAPLNYEPNQMPVLSAAGQGVGWMLMAQETHQAPAKTSSIRLVDHLFAEEGSLFENGLSSDVAHAIHA